MHQNYLDAMALVRAFGKPDLFVTFTANPSWAEVTENLLEGQKASDRPDLVSRVFRLKLASLMEDLVRGNVLGRTVAWTYVVEFQKRGLPHAHIRNLKR